MGLVDQSHFIKVNLGASVGLTVKLTWSKSYRDTQTRRTQTKQVFNITQVNEESLPEY